MTMKSFENAITVIYALGKILLHAAINSAPCGAIANWIVCAGGSTNAVLHLLALANEADVPLVTPSTKC
jgi:dihydroxyacid dehydratase/phosphogluconate dehydratase